MNFYWIFNRQCVLTPLPVDHHEEHVHRSRELVHVCLVYPTRWLSPQRNLFIYNSTGLLYIRFSLKYINEWNKQEKWKFLSCRLLFNTRSSPKGNIHYLSNILNCLRNYCTLILYHLQQQNCVFITSHIQNMFLRRWRICEKFSIQTTDAIKILIWKNHLNFKVVHIWNTSIFWCTYYWNKQLYNQV